MTRPIVFVATALAVFTSSALASGAPGAPTVANAAAPSDARVAAAANAATSSEPVDQRVAVFANVALGMPSFDFVNELAGARFDLAYTPRFSFGMSLAYVNLKGKDGRASNALPEASVAYRVPFGDGSFGIPLRFSGGYLPMNGPTLRLTSGLDFALGERVACELALLEPMVWVTRDRPEFSLNVGAALRATF